MILQFLASPHQGRGEDMRYDPPPKFCPTPRNITKMHINKLFMCFKLFFNPSPQKTLDTALNFSIQFKPSKKQSSKLSLSKAQALKSNVLWMSSPKSKLSARAKFILHKGIRLKRLLCLINRLLLKQVAVTNCIKERPSSIVTKTLKPGFDTNR